MSATQSPCSRQDTLRLGLSGPSRKALHRVQVVVDRALRVPSRSQKVHVPSAQLDVFRSHTRLLGRLKMRRDQGKLASVRRPRVPPPRSGLVQQRVGADEGRDGKRRGPRSSTQCSAYLEVGGNVRSARRLRHLRCAGTPTSFTGVAPLQSDAQRRWAWWSSRFVPGVTPLASGRPRVAPPCLAQEQSIREGRALSPRPWDRPRRASHLSHRYHR
jgi:hypothetical protein